MAHTTRPRPGLRAPLAASCLVALAALGCEESVTSGQYLRCQPELLGAPAPASGPEGTRVVLTGRHLLSYTTSAFDPALDIAVSFGASRGAVIEVVGPYDLVEGACETCATCVDDEVEGCLGCGEACESCLSDIHVRAPTGEGTVNVSLFNGMGQSNLLPFTYTP